MKKTFFILSLIFTVILISVSFYSFARQTVRRLASPIPTIPAIPTQVQPTSTPTNEIQLDGKTYQYYFHKIKEDETLTLIPNFKEATFSGKIFQENGCTFGINGGFYKKEGGPLGLFQIGEKKIGIQITSATFNGILSSSSGLSISSSSTFYPTSTSSSDFILQSGPLIFLKNLQQPIFIEEDYSRRSLIAKSISGDFYLFSIFEKDNRLSGPRLKDLRGIFLSTEFTKLANFDLVLNLDGGSASAYYDKDIQVEEFKPIGSFLCGKKIAK